MKILIVKIGAIGDVVMASAMVTAAKQSTPEVKVSWLCGHGVEKLVRSFSGVSEVMVIDEKKLFFGSIWQRLMELIKAWRLVSFKKYDMVVTGHTDWRYLLLSLSAIAKVRRRFGGRGLVRGRWHAAEYARLVHNRDGPFVASPKIAPITTGSEIVDLNDSNNQPAILIFPGGAKNILREDAVRRWPIEYYRDLAKKFIQKEYRVILSGGSDDIWVKEYFNDQKYVDLIGRLDIIQLVSLCRKCALVVAHDSGPMHIAYASGAKTLALFGPTNPYEKVPNDPNVKVLWGGDDLYCRPCYDGKYYSACPSNECLKSITVDLVFYEALKILSQEIEHSSG